MNSRHTLSIDHSPRLGGSDDETARGRCGHVVCGVSKSRWARLCVHGDGRVHGPSRHLTPTSIAVTTTRIGTCKMVGSPFHLAGTSLKVATGRLEAALARLLDPCYRADENRRLANHLDREFPFLFAYLMKCPGLEATNYRAEPAIRPAAVIRTVWGGNRTAAGARTQEILMSVLRPSQQNDVDPLPLIADLLRTPTSWRWCRYAPLPPDRFPTRDPRTVASSVRRTQIRASRRHASPTGATRHASPRRDPGRPLCDPHEAWWARPTAPPRRCTQPPIHANRGERSCSVSLKHPLFLRPLPANQLPLVSLWPYRCRRVGRRHWPARGAWAS